MNNPYPSETGCCPRFNPEPWQGRELHWEGKLFLKDRVRCLWYMPLNFGQIMVRNMGKISEASAFPPEPPIVLSEHPSPWRTDVFLEVAREIPNAEHVQLSGSFLCKVFEGPYRDARVWCRQMTDWVRSKGKAIQRQFMFYTTCPKCAKHYGKNYVVILAQV
jgi:hypothetical protein